MNNGTLIQFKVNEKIGRDRLLRLLPEEELNEFIAKGYFKPAEDDKYIFTQDGYDFAWS